MAASLLYNLPRMMQCHLLQNRCTKPAPFTAGALDGKLAIITGANSGVGFETAKGLALRGCDVITLCRSMDKATACCDAINAACRESQSAGSADALPLDLGDLRSVADCAAVLRQRLLGVRAIDFFICNAGIALLHQQTGQLSAQGVELHFATNHLGHFALIGRLLDMLLRPPEDNNTSSDHGDSSSSGIGNEGRGCRVVVLTGDIAVLQDDASPQFTGLNLFAYCRSKIANQAFALQLQQLFGRRLDAVYVVHPGVVDSGLIKPPTGIMGLLEVLDRNIRPFFFVDAAMGAQSTLRCCLCENNINYTSNSDACDSSSESAVVDTVDGLRWPSGTYYHNVFGVTAPHPRAREANWREQLWATSQQLCQQHGLQLLY